MGPEGLFDALKQLSGALSDAWVVTDEGLGIVEFNGVFRALFPRAVARQLKKQTFPEVMALELSGQPFDLASECVAKNTSLRYDEIIGRAKNGEVFDLIASATPLTRADGDIDGVFVTLRNVTDEAQVQQKYRTMLEEEAKAREALQQQITDAEAELVVVKDGLNLVEKELLDYRKGLLVG